MDDRHAYAQAAQQGNVQQQVAKIVVGNDGAVDCNREDAIAKLGNIVQDFAEVGESIH